MVTGCNDYNDQNFVNIPNFLFTDNSFLFQLLYKYFING